MIYKRPAQMLREHLDAALKSHGLTMESATNEEKAIATEEALQGMLMEFTWASCEYLSNNFTNDEIACIVREQAKRGWRDE